MAAFFKKQHHTCPQVVRGTEALLYSLQWRLPAIPDPTHGKKAVMFFLIQDEPFNVTSSAEKLAYWQMLAVTVESDFLTTSYEGEGGIAKPLVCNLKMGFLWDTSERCWTLHNFPTNQPLTQYTTVFQEDSLEINSKYNRGNTFCAITPNLISREV